MQALLLYFAERHTVANVFTLMLVLLGLSTLLHIQRDNFPSVDLAEMIVTMRYPGASPQDVELNVTNKIEEELKGVDGLRRVTSFSMENISVIDIKIDLDSKDIDKIKTDIRDAVSRTTGLPPEIDDQPEVREITTATGIPIIEIGLTGDIPYAELREYARRAEKSLEDIHGVAGLNALGVPELVERDGTLRFEPDIEDDLRLRLGEHLRGDDLALGDLAQRLLVQGEEFLVLL